MVCRRRSAFSQCSSREARRQHKDLRARCHTNSSNRDRSTAALERGCLALGSSVAELIDYVNANPGFAFSQFSVSRCLSVWKPRHSVGLASHDSACHGLRPAMWSTPRRSRKLSAKAVYPGPANIIFVIRGNAPLQIFPCLRPCCTGLSFDSLLCKLKACGPRGRLCRRWAVSIHRLQLPQLLRILRCS